MAADPTQPPARAPRAATVRPERPADEPAIDRVLRAAFGRDDEALIVARMRAGAPPIASLVAEVDGALVGHVLFTEVTVTGEDGTWTAAGLAPLSVAPEHQRRGIGAALTRAGLAECARAGHPAVFVLGHADYYPRFGFRPARALGFECAYDVPDDVFQVAELTPGALGGRRGFVRYRAELEGA